jgi:hypothetical protein
MKRRNTMTRTATLENVITTVHQQSQHYFDEVIPVQDMEFDSLTQMWVSGRRVEILPSAQKLISNRLRVPHSYLSRCPAELQARNLNYWIEQERSQRDTFFCRFDANKLRAAFSERYTASDNMEVLTKMLEYGFDPEGEIHFSLDDEMLVLNIPEPSRTFYLAEKDKIVPGISIANSEVGIIALSIEAFYYRLVCSNGLIQKTAVDARYKHISRKAMEEFPDILRGVISQSQQGQDRFLISTQTQVNNPESTIDTFARQFQIPQEEVQIVKQAYYLEEGATMFHIINAFTRAAQDRSLSASGAYRLERAGGTILGMVKS